MTNQSSEQGEVLPASEPSNEPRREMQRDPGGSTQERNLAQRRPVSLRRGSEGLELFPSPFRLMGRMFEDMERMFAGFSPARSLMSDLRDLPNLEIDLFLRGDELVVRADLPGLDKDEVSINVLDGRLIIEAERKSEHEERPEGMYRFERSYGVFRRAIPLPDTVDLDSAQARMKNGVLEVTFKNAAQAPRARRIQIQEGSTSSQSESAPAESGPPSVH